MALPCLAQDPTGREVAAALKRTDIPPAPRLADGHPDLGNGKSAWASPAIDNLGGGKTPRGAGGAQPEKVVEVPMLPAAKALFDKRQNGYDIQDPEAYCLVPGSSWTTFVRTTTRYSNGSLSKKALTDLCEP